MNFGCNRETVGQNPKKTLEQACVMLEVTGGWEAEDKDTRCREAKIWFAEQHVSLNKSGLVGWLSEKDTGH